MDAAFKRVTEATIKACFTEERQVEERLRFGEEHTKPVRNGRTKNLIVTATPLQVTPILASATITTAEILMLVDLRHSRGATSKMIRAGAIAMKFLVVRVRFFL